MDAAGHDHGITDRSGSRFAPSERSCALTPGATGAGTATMPPPCRHCCCHSHWPLASHWPDWPRSPRRYHTQSGVRGPAAVLLPRVEGRARARSRSRHATRSTLPVRSTVYRTRHAVPVPQHRVVVQQWQWQSGGRANGAAPAARAM